MVDLDREVEIIVNGRPSYKRKPARSAEVLLERCRKDRDREAIYSASVTLKVE
jgi:hypothetical protein